MHSWIKDTKKKLVENNVNFYSGLTKKKLKAIEKFIGHSFPNDYRVQLENFVISDKETPNWHIFDVKKYQTMLFSFHEIHLGLEFAVNSFGGWHSEWGDYPDSKKERLKIAQEKIRSYPPLIPVCSNKYINTIPHKKGHSIYSIHSTDIIFYGNTFKDFINYNWDDNPEIFLQTPNKDFFISSNTPRPLELFDAYNLFVDYSSSNSFFPAWNYLNSHKRIEYHLANNKPFCRVNEKYSRVWRLESFSYEILLPKDVYSENHALEFLNTRSNNVNISRLLSILHFEKENIINQIKNKGIINFNIENIKECAFRIEELNENHSICKVISINNQKIYFDIDFSLLKNFNFDSF